MVMLFALVLFLLVLLAIGICGSLLQGLHRFLPLTVTAFLIFVGVAAYSASAEHHELGDTWWARALAALIGVAFLADIGVYKLFSMPIKSWLAGREDKRIEQSLLTKVFLATEQHLATLAKKRVQLVKRDSYGNEKLDAWIEEVGYFLREHIGPSLSAKEYDALLKDTAKFGMAIDWRVQQAA
jgi:hypothetical protein